MTLVAWLAAAYVSGAPPPDASNDPLPDEPLVDDTPAAAPARVTWSGAWQERVTVDTAWDAGERPFEGLSELVLAARITPDPTLELGLAGRLRHRLRLDADAHADGLFEPELREATLTWRPGANTVVTAGYARPSWLRLVDPAPVDLRRGPFMDGREALPVLAAELTQTVGPLTLGALWLPLFVPTHVPLGEAPWGNWTPAAALPRRDLADYPGPREDGLTSSELGAIAHLRSPALDLTAAWLWRWDRASAPLGAAAMTRQHVLGLGAAFPVGPLRATTELAATLDETAWAPALAHEQRPFVRWQLGLGWTPTLPVDLAFEAHGTHALGAHARHFLGDGPSDVWLGGRLLLMLAFDGIVRLDARGGADLLRKSWDFHAELALRATSRWELALGLGVADGDPSEGGLGAIFAARDRLWLRSTLQL